MTTVVSLLEAIADVGRDAKRGGYSRPVLSDAELTLRSWFVDEARSRDLRVEVDRNGGLWAWWDLPGRTDDASRRDAVVTGSHLDSVPGGGAYDGPLGVASALAAIDDLRAREAAGTLIRTKAVAILVPAEEEGSRFGVACLGSRLMTGAITPERALALTDRDGVSFAAAAAHAGVDLTRAGRDDEALARIGVFVELHVEQGRGLNGDGHRDAGASLAVATSILGHGRWRLSFSGRGDHAGTTLMADRADPMIAAARTVLAVRDIARRVSDARATVGRIEPVPGGTNVIPSRVDVWLDARHPDDHVTAEVVAQVSEAAAIAAFEEGGSVAITEESFSGTVDFDAELSADVLASVRRTDPAAPMLATGAGHDAGILAAERPTAMIFVRNPSGVSHAPEEFATDADAALGVRGLADALADLASRA